MIEGGREGGREGGVESGSFCVKLIKNEIDL